MMMPDRSQRDRLPAMFHSSGLFAGGLCCLIHARPFSLAWREAKTSTELRIYQQYVPKDGKSTDQNVTANQQGERRHEAVFTVRTLSQHVAWQTKTYHALSLRISRPSKEYIGTFSLILLSLSLKIDSQLLNNTWSCKEDQCCFTFIFQKTAGYIA